MLRSSSIYHQSNVTVLLCVGIVLSNCTQVVEGLYYIPIYFIVGHCIANPVMGQVVIIIGLPWWL